MNGSIYEFWDENGEKSERIYRDGKFLTLFEYQVAVLASIDETVRRNGEVSMQQAAEAMKQMEESRRRDERRQFEVVWDRESERERRKEEEYRREERLHRWNNEIISIYVEWDYYVNPDREYNTSGGWDSRERTLSMRREEARELLHGGVNAIKNEAGCYGRVRNVRWRVSDNYHNPKP